MIREFSKILYAALCACFGLNPSSTEASVLIRQAYQEPDRQPQTDEASAQFMNAFSAVLIGYTNRGIPDAAPWRGLQWAALQRGMMSRTVSLSGRTAMTVSLKRTGRPIRPCRFRQR